CRSPHMILAVCNELSEVGKMPPGDHLAHALPRAVKNLSRLQRYSRQHLVDDPMAMPLVAFAEACAFHGVDRKYICEILSYISRSVPPISRIASDYEETTRHYFVRAVTLKAALLSNSQPIPEDIIPPREATIPRSNYDAECTRNAERM